MVPARVLAVVVAACCGAAALVYTVTPRNADRPPAPPPTATVSKVEATRYRDAAVKFYMQSGDEGRKVSDAFGNDADFAGVRRLMDVFLNEGLCQPTTVVLIGGVNEGQLASKILELCPSLTLHGFEVQEGLARSTGELLAAIGINAVVRHLGMGDEELDGIAVTGQQGSEQAGLYTAEGRWSDEPVQGTVSTVKLSRWAPRQGIDSVAYLVIDAEGFEPKIIRGMELHLESSQRLFPLFQFELGGTWADEDSRHGDDKWDMRATAAHIEENGYELYLIGRDNWMRVFPSYFHKRYLSFQNEGFGIFAQGNLLCVHAVWGDSRLRAVVRAVHPPRLLSRGVVAAETEGKYGVE